MEILNQQYRFKSFTVFAGHQVELSQKYGNVSFDRLACMESSLSILRCFWKIESYTFSILTSLGSSRLQIHAHTHYTVERALWPHMMCRNNWTRWPIWDVLPNTTERIANLNTFSKQVSENFEIKKNILFLYYQPLITQGRNCVNISGPKNLMTGKSLYDPNGCGDEATRVASVNQPDAIKSASRSKTTHRRNKVCDKGTVHRVKRKQICRSLTRKDFVIGNCWKWKTYKIKNNSRNET